MSITCRRHVALPEVWKIQYRSRLSFSVAIWVIVSRSARTIANWSVLAVAYWILHYTVSFDSKIGKEITRGGHLLWLCITVRDRGQDVVKRSRPFRSCGQGVKGLYNGWSNGQALLKPSNSLTFTQYNECIWQNHPAAASISLNHTSHNKAQKKCK